jgi:two-component system OmpR family response regulator
MSTIKILSKILLVEDEPDIQIVVKIALEAMSDFIVDTCDSGETAIEKAKANPPDLILLDVMLPDMDGPAILGVLRKNSQTQQIPIIFMTAKVQPKDVNYYKDIGALGVIAKPFDPMLLVKMITDIWRDAND